jgi:methyl-accepting chemotaxis protein
MRAIAVTRIVSAVALASVSLAAILVIIKPIGSDNIATLTTLFVLLVAGSAQLVQMAAMRRTFVGASHAIARWASGLSEEAPDGSPIDPAVVEKRDQTKAALADIERLVRRDREMEEKIGTLQRLATAPRQNAAAVFSSDGSLLKANQTFYEVLGLDESAVDDLLHDGLPLFRQTSSISPSAIWTEVQATGQAKHRLQVETPAGLTKIYDLFYETDDTGGTGSVGLTVREVTDEVSARQCAALFKAAVEEDSAALILVDAGGKVVCLSRGALDQKDRIDAVLPGVTSSGDQPAFLSPDLTDRLMSDGSVDILVGRNTYTATARQLPDRHLIVRVTDRTEEKHSRAVLDAVDRNQAIVEFAIDGTIEAANANFLRVVGYELGDLAGRHHQLLVDKEERESEAYRTFWARLAAGEPQTGCFRRISRDGNTVWLHASYIPITDASGKVLRVIKTAFDVTARELQATEHRSLMRAVNMTQATVEFDLDGHVLRANENFLQTLGYAAEDVVGKHHRIFCSEEEARSEAYSTFWKRLGEGRFDAGRYTRYGKDGRKVVIQAAYTPVFGQDGRPVKVIKFATDITEAAQQETIADFKSSAFEQASVAMMMVDRDLIIHHINGSTIELFKEKREAFQAIFRNFDPEAMVGRCIDDFHKDPGRIRRILDNPANLPYSADITLGEMKINLAIGAVYDRQGKYVGCSLEWTDVTTQRIHASIMDAFDRTQGVVEFDLDGTVSAANACFASLLGHQPEAVIGRSFVSLLTDLSNDQYGDGFWRALAIGENWSGRVEHKGANGREVWMQCVFTPVLDGHGKVFKVVATCSDVTEEELRGQDEATRQKKRERDQRQVVLRLASGLQRLSEGDFTVTIEEAFPEEYEKLRDDFNSSVSKLLISEEEKRRHTVEQEKVVAMLASAMQELRQGSLECVIEDRFPEAYEGVRNDYNAAVTALREIIEAIVAAADGIKTGSSEIAKAADALSNRTENQAASLEETAAALDQITTTVKQTAEGALQANKTALEARTSADGSGKVVASAVEAMDRIAKSSKQVAQIISVIDDIAFQTNLLALNAGVEAARAGDAGRGFAVVAHEVRGLAQRSAEAAKEIKSLITVSSQEVSDGVDLVGQAGRSLHEIVEQVTGVCVGMDEISASAKEQSLSLSEVNQAMNRMDQVTQENASMVEQSTAASHALAEAAQTLLTKVAHFQLSSLNRRHPGGATDLHLFERKIAASVHAKPQLIQVQQETESDPDWREF